MTEPESFDGGCSCGAVRYRMRGVPMIVHGCHCSWCQRETGSAFAMNAVIEADRVTLLKGEVNLVLTPSASGKGQRIARCPACHVALWSHYAGAGDPVRFVRVGTLDTPGRFPPDVHIFTSTRQPWVVLPPEARVYAEYYKPQDVWSAESQRRWRAAKGAA